MISIYPEWRGRQLMPPLNREVWQELLELGIDLWDIAYILENGYDCPEGKRKKAIIEKCIRKGNCVIKAVVELKVSKKGVEYWKIRHVGKYKV